MKKAYTLYWDKLQIKARLYKNTDDGNLTVMATSKNNALEIAENIYRLKEKEYHTQDVINRAEDLNLKLSDNEIEDAVDHMLYKMDCNTDYWTNVNNAIISAKGGSLCDDYISADVKEAAV